MKNVLLNGVFKDIEDLQRSELDQKEKFLRATRFAKEVYKNRIDIYGNPAYDHLERLSKRVIEIEGTYNSHAIISLLHDIFEIEDITYEQIENEFGLFIAESVNLLKISDSLDHETNLDRLHEIAGLNNSMLVIIKMLDYIDLIQNTLIYSTNVQSDINVHEIKNCILPIFEKYHVNKLTYRKVLNELTSLSDQL